MAIMTILLELAIMAWHNVAINMVIMSVSAKNWQNIDSLWKRIEKICIGLKVMATTKYFVKKIFSFGHNFLTDAIFCNPQAIYILPVLCRDTHIDHIYGHINPYKIGHYGHFVDIGHYGPA